MSQARQQSLRLPKGIDVGLSPVGILGPFLSRFKSLLAQHAASRRHIRASMDRTGVRKALSRAA